MKVIIAGSRDIHPTVDELNDIIKNDFPFSISEIISGKAKGIDTSGENYAKYYNIPIKEFPAKWYDSGKLDRGAGHKRNKHMAEYSDALIAIWNMKTPGTKSMIKYAISKKLKILVVDYNTMRVKRNYKGK